MTFYINYTNGANLTAISDGTINTTSTSLTLIGKNFPTYGQLLNQDLVSMLENWANSTSPNNPLVGQLWYDSGNSVIKYYRGGAASNYWQDVANILYSSSTPSSPQQNDLWWDSTNQQLKYYDNRNFITIGPQTTNDGLNRVSGTNSFIVQIGGNNVFTVDAYGRVNAAYNPVVQGYGFASGVPFTGSGLLSPQTIIPATVSINIGSYFNAATGIFTCPVAGIYQVSGVAISLGYNSLPAPYQKIEWWKNGVTTYISCQAQNPASITSESFDTPMVATGYVQCAAGDTLQLVMAADSNGQIDNNNSTLSIRLVA
jgi:C1q domain